MYVEKSSALLIGWRLWCGLGVVFKATAALKEFGRRSFLRHDCSGTAHRALLMKPSGRRQRADVSKHLSDIELQVNKHTLSCDSVKYSDPDCYCQSAGPGERTRRYGARGHSAQRLNLQLELYTLAIRI